MQETAKRSDRKEAPEEKKKRGLSYGDNQDNNKKISHRVLPERF